MLCFHSKTIECMTKAKKFWFTLTGRMHKLILWKSLHRGLFLLIHKNEFWGFLKTTFWSTWAACLYYLFSGITGTYSSIVKFHYKRNMIVLMREFKKWGLVPSSARPGFFTAHSWSVLSLSDRCASSWNLFPQLKWASLIQKWSIIIYHFTPSTCINGASVEADNPSVGLSADIPWQHRKPQSLFRSSEEQLLVIPPDVLQMQFLVTVHTCHLNSGFP